MSIVLCFKPLNSSMLADQALQATNLRAFLEGLWRIASSQAVLRNNWVLIMLLIKKKTTTLILMGTIQYIRIPVLIQSTSSEVLLSGITQRIYYLKEKRQRDFCLPGEGKGPALMEGTSERYYEKLWTASCCLELWYFRHIPNQLSSSPIWVLLFFSFSLYFFPYFS